ncbi:MAG: glycosyltransferase family 2 protein [Candidatus Aminicenantes bacterium]|nr:glycosyltransferase family 2 protein [Candidatus Aminicenantes bacterium]
MPGKSSLNDGSPLAVKLSVIIVSFNQFALLKAAIDSLKRNPPSFNYEIIVVDNHSNEDVQEYLNDFFWDIRIIRNPVNHGFGWANNRGVQAARGEYLLFLNNDTEIIGTAVDAMLQVMEKDSGIGALGPMLLNTDGSFQLSYGFKISLFAELYQKTMARLLGKWKNSRRRSGGILKKTAWVSGACLLTRKDLFEKEPPFDENIFLYFEDHDLCLRVWAMRKKVVYYSGARVVHHGGQSVGSWPGAVLEYRKSQLYLYRKHLAHWQSVLLRYYLACKFQRKLRRANDDSEKQGAAAILKLLKEK